jgi:hypothetical protein
VACRAHYLPLGPIATTVIRRHRIFTRCSTSRRTLRMSGGKIRHIRGWRGFSGGRVVVGSAIRTLIADSQATDTISGRGASATSSDRDVSNPRLFRPQLQFGDGQGWSKLFDLQMVKFRSMRRNRQVHRNASVSALRETPGQATERHSHDVSAIGFVAV